MDVYHDRKTGNHIWRGCVGIERLISLGLDYLSYKGLFVSPATRMCPTRALEVIMELTPLYIMINQTAKQTILHMTVGKGDFVSKN